MRSPAGGWTANLPNSRLQPGGYWKCEKRYLQIGNFAPARFHSENQPFSMPINSKTFGKRQRNHQPPPAPSPAREVPEIDPRNTARKRTLFKGVLSYGQNCAFTIDCVITDFSEAGARVQIQPGPPVPTDVYLVHVRERAAYRASVSWRRDDTLGLRFVSRHDLEDPTTEELKTLRRHCVEHEPRSAMDL